jgi:hypothetical protein
VPSVAVRHSSDYVSKINRHWQHQWSHACHAQLYEISPPRAPYRLLSTAQRSPAPHPRLPISAMRPSNFRAATVQNS